MTKEDKLWEINQRLRKHKYAASAIWHNYSLKREKGTYITKRRKEMKRLKDRTITLIFCIAGLLIGILLQQIFKIF